MRAVINANLLKSRAAQRGDAPFEVRDERLAGFILRVQPSGVRSYYAQIRRGQRVALGKVGQFTPDEARERCKKVLGNVAHDRPPLEGLDGSAKLTLGEFIGSEEEGSDGSLATYRRWLLANRPKSAERTLQRLETCFGEWYHRSLSEITVERIETWRSKKLAAGRSPTTVLRDVMTLSGALRLAVRMKKIGENPVRDVEKPSIDRAPKVRFLDAAEEQRLRAALRERDAGMQAARESANRWRRQRHQESLPALPHFGDHLSAAVLVSMHTGLRRGELLALHWSAVDFKIKQITIEGATAKNQQTRFIRLNTEALDVLKRWKEQAPDAERVFPIDTGFKTAWSALLERAKITRFRWHDLRHTFASRLAQRGVALNTIRVLLGHGSLSMVLRYAHLEPTQLEDAVELLVQP